MSRLQFGSPDVVVSPSRWLLDFYVSRKFFPKSKKAVLPNPVQLPTTSYLLPTKGAALRLLYAGQIEEHKGILWLVEALRNFRGEFELRIVGGGAKLAHLRRATAGDSRYVLRGPTAPEQLPAYFAEADLTVVPSLALENCPGVILESFAAGTPVLASRAGGIPELVAEGKNGWLFAPGDAEDLRSRLSFCIQNRALLEEMRASAQESVSHLTMNRYLESLLPLL
jgi:glycosyltransferase involved in cell wall biosynthesis